MALNLLGLPVIRVGSTSKPGVLYEVDRMKRVCSCPGFVSAGHCKHLDWLGVFQTKQFTPLTYPTFSQALSGMVKSIRLRRVEDAIYWLVYLDAYEASEKLGKKAARFRVARRLLQGTAEDGMSLAVMEKTASNFQYMCQLDTPLIYLAAEVLRICKVPNWWHPSTGGSEYLHACLVGERRHGIYGGPWTKESALTFARRAVDEQNTVDSCGSINVFLNLGMTNLEQCTFYAKLAEEVQCDPAQRLCALHMGAHGSLTKDTNFTGQAAWYLAGGVSPVADKIESVVAKEVYDALSAAKERWKSPLPIANWMCDGHHCAGKDPRFAGFVPNMYAVCLAFKKYGRVNPDDRWLPTFWCTDGLLLG